MPQPWMRRSFKLPVGKLPVGKIPAGKILVGIVAGVVAAVAARGSVADPTAIERRLVHPDGVSIELQWIDFRDASIVLSATITNMGDREVRLNRARSFLLDDGAHGVHYLSQPADNPELRIPARTQLSGDLVFVGPLATAARGLALSSNRGIGTKDNPNDDAPVLEASLPIEGKRTNGGGAAASHPDGATLSVRRIVTAPAACLVSLLATNGNDRTIVLNSNAGFVLVDDQGAAAPLNPPSDNRELVIPPGDRLDADLLFDCRRINAAGTLTLVSNRGTAGTPDNPYDTLPVFTLMLPVEHAAAALPEGSRATVAPLPRSHLSETATPAAAAPALEVPARHPAAAPPAPASPPPRSSPGDATPRPATPAETTAPPAIPHKPLSLAELETALRTEKTDRGLRLVMPADALFQAKQGELDDAAATPLATLTALVEAVRPREIVVIGHTDSVGDDDANLALSKQRAHAVAAWLAAHDSKARPHFAEQGYGRTRPVAPNHNADGSDNPAGRAANRRIEIFLRNR
jgi:outer membrane protein OmpA-like peptidoglycan-associated protein